VAGGKLAGWNFVSEKGRANIFLLGEEVLRGPYGEEGTGPQRRCPPCKERTLRKDRSGKLCEKSRGSGQPGAGRQRGSALSEKDGVEAFSKEGADCPRRKIFLDAERNER